MYPLGKTMQLKLKLEHIDNYRRGKLLDQKALQTGQPRGSFSKGDAHPSVEGVFYRHWVQSGEIWSTLESITKNKQYQAEYNKSSKAIEYQKKYRKTDKCKANKARYRQSDKGKASQAKYNKSDKAKATWAEYKKQYQKTEKYKESLIRYNKSDKRKESKKRYNQTDKAKKLARHYSTKRRVIKAKASVNLTECEEGEIKQIYAHAVRVSNKLQIPFEVDHIVPLNKGGLHHPSNLQIAPTSWNRSKHNRNTERWLPNGM